MGLCPSRGTRRSILERQRNKGERDAAFRRYGETSGASFRFFLLSVLSICMILTGSAEFQCNSCHCGIFVLSGEFVKIIEDAGAIPLLLEAWAFRDGDKRFRSVISMALGICSVPGCLHPSARIWLCYCCSAVDTFDKMQERLISGCRHAGIVVWT